VSYKKNGFKRSFKSFVRNILFDSHERRKLDLVLSRRGKKLLIDKSKFLIGDAAHRFPPAGGFGMNTGLHDAHNIAWKLAKVVNNNASEKILTSYDVERKQIATETTALSLKNYEKTINTAATLGVGKINSIYI
jgi:2-polyprenyl-6-methoxyphenol hydroxylase-like FAD-dependent oxidoreductase